MSRKTFRFEVEVTIDETRLAGSEYNRIKHYLGTVTGLKNTICRGVPCHDNEFRDIDPLSGYITKVNVRKKR